MGRFVIPRGQWRHRGRRWVRPGTMWRRCRGRARRCQGREGRPMRGAAALDPALRKGAGGDPSAWPRRDRDSREGGFVGDMEAAAAGDFFGGFSRVTAEVFLSREMTFVLWIHVCNWESHRNELPPLLTRFPPRTAAATAHYICVQKARGRCREGEDHGGDGGVVAELDGAK